MPPKIIVRSSPQPVSDNIIRRRQQENLIKLAVIFSLVSGDAGDKQWLAGVFFQQVHQDFFIENPLMLVIPLLARRSRVGTALAGRLVHVITKAFLGIIGGITSLA